MLHKCCMVLLSTPSPNMRCTAGQQPCDKQDLVQVPAMHLSWCRVLSSLHQFMHLDASTSSCTDVAKVTQAGQVSEAAHLEEEAHVVAQLFHVCKVCSL